MGWALVVFVCFGAPWLTRALLLQEKHLPVRAFDLRGILADASVALLVIGIAGTLLQLGRWWGRASTVVLLVVFVGASFALYEFISVFDSLYAFSHITFLGDVTFLGGSARHVRHPALLLSMLLAAIAGGAVATKPGKRWWRGWIVALGCCAVAQVAIPVSHSFDEWRQRHAFEANASIPRADKSARSSAIRTDLRRIFRADLRGRRWAGPLESRPNVLLILVEGASGAYLPSVAAAQGVQSTTSMPRLDALARKHVLLSRVVSHQRQTNRGEYGILCGEYPKLLTDQSKMTEQAYGKPRRCLPALLRDAGYATVYIQAAPLGFMLKDQFMPKAGFEELIGEPWFENAYARTDWGVDDKAFFEQARDRILALHRDERPFFATMLTVGTHHPYTVPNDYAREQPLLDAHDRAFGWADDALADFIHALDEHGVLRDTVVVITSDESAGLPQSASATQRLLSQSWSFVVVLLPVPQAKRIDALFGHVDAALSIADLLGMEAEGAGFVGRSWFRQYDSPRFLFAGNTYARSVMMWEPSGSVVICDESLQRCTRTVPDDDLIFGPKRQSEPATDGERKLLGEVARLTRSGREDLSAAGTLTLLADREVEIHASDGKKLLVGGQYLRAPAGSRLRVEIDLEVDGAQAVVDFDQETFLDGYPKLARKGISVRDGQRWQLRYEIGVPHDAGQLVIELHATLAGGQAATIRIASAQLTMIPARATSSESVVITDTVSTVHPR